MNEQIQKAIDIAVEKRLSETLSIFNLPLISKYKVFSFSGRANGALLSLNFSIDEILGRLVTVKSIRIIPYYFGVGNDIWLFDGVTNSVEATYNNQRIVHLLDDFVSGTKIDFLINGGNTGIFPDTGVLYPLDINLDNIFYKYPEKIQSINFQITSNVINDLTTGALVNPNIKVLVECYVQ